jgi:1-acyl-sn-glycerol-3-phosphate acyltransferase
MSGHFTFFLLSVVFYPPELLFLPLQKPKTVKKFFLASLSILLWIYFVLSSMILVSIATIIWLLTVIPDRNLRILQRFSCFWGAHYIWVIPLWKLKIYGRNKLSDKKLQIWVCNHQSLADILVMNSLFKHFRWTSKAENFRIPFVGWNLWFNRSIRIYRGAGDAWQKFEAQAVKALSDGNSLLIFAEGTRSKTGNMGKFKEGAFRLALQTRTEIQPMVLDGTSKAIPKSGWVLTGRQEMILKVLDPMPYESFKDITASQLADKVQGIIEKALNEIRAK